MIDTLDIGHLEPKVEDALFAFLNSVKDPEDIVSKSRSHAEIIKGLSTGTSVAIKILDFRKELGRYSAIEELQKVPYFTEEKILTLAAVYYIEKGFYNPKIISSPLPGNDILPPPPPPPGGGPTNVGNPIPGAKKLVKINVFARGSGKAVHLRSYLTRKTTGIEFENIHPGRLPGSWTVTFSVEGEPFNQSHELRLDFLDAGKLFLLGVEVSWNPLLMKTMTVRV